MPVPSTTGTGSGKVVRGGGAYRVADVGGNDTRTNDEAVGRWADEAAT